jgi:hypothetical protein
MSVEARIALDVTRAWVASSGAGRAGDVLVEGLARYLHTLAVEDLFDRRYQRRAYAVHAEPMLRGSFTMPIRGIHRTRLTTLRAETESIAAQLALAFATLERYLAPTRLQRAVTAAVASRPSDIDTFVTDMESALGQELSWLFETVLAEGRYDYALTEFASDPALCQDAPCFRTRAVVERRTDSAFASTTVPGVLLTFADGQSLTSASDARVSIEEFYFESPAPADTATIDSAGVLLLDRNRLDNRKTLAPATDVNVARWTGQWAVWLQHALLAYASFF